MSVIGLYRASLFKAKGKTLVNQFLRICLWNCN